MEGRFLSMILVPNREAIEAEKKAEAASAAAESKEVESSEAAEPQGG
jgi:hypothetical protein